MTDNTVATINPKELSRSLAEIAGRSQQLVQDFLAEEESAQRIGVADALRMSRLFQDLYARLMADPLQLAQGQMAFWQDYMLLMQRSTLRMMGFDIEPMIRPQEKDKRFKHESWESNLLFDFIKQSYLLTADYIHRSVKNVDGLDDKTGKKIDFYTRQFIDALSPSNFLATNPEILGKTIESRGQNLLKGLNNLLEDLKRGRGTLKIRMTDPDAFEVGRDLALTPGKVIYQTDLAQLIQYEPTTDQVYKQPVLFIPPWINKYYILDLQPQNSLVKWMVEQGHTVFVISWRNPTAEFADKTFDDYMLEGPLAALGAIEQATGVKKINLAGYCLGGTLLACTLAYMAAKGDRRAHSATFFTSLLDFEDPGELEIFIDEDQLKSLEQQMQRRGYLTGAQMARTMSSLRANDLIWSFFVSNYLRGEDPFPFDLLYWNQDPTNMPARMHIFYLRNMYLENRLREAGGIALAGEPIDLAKVKVPAFFLSTREDHIAPWKATYRGMRLLSGRAQFVLSGSGHIAGVINPPAKNKYGYWTNANNPADPNEWVAAAEYHTGSWWPYWLGWLNRKGGAKVNARRVGAGELEPIEDAPGAYVKKRHG